MWDLNKLPAYSKCTDTISTKQYYTIKRALSLGGKPALRYRLEDFPDYDVIITQHQWRCVDTRQGDFPVLVWSGFEQGDIQAIHQPVQVTLECYHYSVDNLAKEILASILKQHERERSEGVLCPLPRKLARPAKQWETSNKVRLRCL